MFCSNCGNQNNSENKFCINCGSSLNSTTNNVKKSDSNKETSLVLGIICLISSFFINIFCFIPGIISIVYANKYKKESGKLGVGFGLSLCGMIFSFIMFLLGLIVFLSVMTFIGNVGNEIEENINQPIIPEYNYNIPNV